MVLDLSNVYIKQPNEELPIEVNFGSLSVLPRGAKEIVSASASAKKWKRTHPESVESAPEFLVSSTPTILPPTNCKIQFRVKDGTDGYNYQITVDVTFDNGVKMEEEVYVRVIER